MKKLLLIFLFHGMLYSSLPAQSAQAKIDTLLLDLAKEQIDSHRVNLMGALASYYRSINLDQAQEYISKSLELSKKINYKSGEIKSLFMSGVIYRMQGEMDKALEYGKSSLRLATEEEDWYWAGANGNSLGNAYGDIGMYDTCVLYYFKALEAYEKGGLKSKAAMVYNNLGDTFYEQEKNDLAEEYLKKALEIYKAEDQMSLAAMTLMNLGKGQSKDSIAFDYLNQALDIHRENDDLAGIASVNINIGARLINNETFEAALPYYLEALELLTTVGHKRKMAIANSSLGRIYFKTNQAAKAIKHYEAALVLTEKTNSVKEREETYKNLANSYADQLDYEKAFNYLKLSKAMYDSLVSKQNLSLSSELEAKYDDQQKEATLAIQRLEIEKQKYNRNQIIFFGILILLGLSAIFQYYYFNQKKKKSEALLALEKEKKDSESLRHINEIKTKFFANISHELRTPLTLILGPMEEILKHPNKKPSAEDLSFVYDNSKTLLRLINEIMDLTKMDAGLLELQKSSVNLDQLNRRIFFSFQSLAHIHDIKMEFENEIPEETLIELDINKFEKILNNLLSNAIKFSKKGGIIKMQIGLSKAEGEDQLFFKVHDSGEGIPKNESDKIFERYYQSNSGELAGGTGIGLALSKELAHLFGGNLAVESTLGTGSVFTLNIPFVKAKAMEESLEKYTAAKLETIDSETENVVANSYQPILLNGEKPEILVVEDHQEMSRFLLKILSPFYNCTKALNGEEALKKLTEKKYDLITSDVMMPVMDGFEFRAAIRGNAEWNQIPFIMLTARSLEADKIKGLKLGIDDYITKPFGAGELLARIDNLLSNKSERELFNKEKSTEEELGDSVDHQLLKKAEQIILDHLNNPDFSVTQLAKEVGYSQRQLGRIVKKLTGFSPVNFILEIRLQKAFQLINARSFATISEVRYEIGIESHSYFAAKFKKRFGKSPSEV